MCANTLRGKMRSMQPKPTNGYKKIVYERDDWIWVHMQKEKSPKCRRSKWKPKGDCLFQVLERINNNPYKLNLPNKYNISALFNIFDISPFDMQVTI